jgi:predicted transposase YdaD
LNVNLPSAQDQDISADQIFYVEMDNTTDVLFHIEFQGKSSKRPMKWRMLDYMSRIAESNDSKKKEVNLCSVIFYVGEDAGSTDTGEYEIKCPHGKISLAWRYQVKHLWKIKAEELLAFDSAPLLVLVGQTIIEDPQEFLPKVVERIKQEEDDQKRGSMLTLLVGLMADEELLEMLEQLIYQDELIDTPYLRRIRTQGREEGLQEGIQQGLLSGRLEGRQEGVLEGLQKGLQEGKEEGLQEGLLSGRLETRREVTLEVLISRFDPVASTYRKIERQLRQINELATLEDLFTTAMRCHDFPEFEVKLSEVA